MNLEMKSMYFNEVWELVDLPKGVKLIGCKWIYKRKRDAYGRVENFKARLVAKGYTQKEGIDYEETFSLVAMIKSIYILLSIATHLDYKIWQMDVKTAFLNGRLEESIYMVQPEGFIDKWQEHIVCKLWDPFMDSNKPLGLETLDLTKRLNLSCLSKVQTSHVSIVK